MVGEHMKKNRGMTIIEVVVSFVILVIISAMVLSVSMNYLVQFHTVRRDITGEGFERRGETEEQIEEIVGLIQLQNEIVEIISSTDDQIAAIDLKLNNLSLSLSSDEKKKLKEEKESLKTLKGEKETEQKKVEDKLKPYRDKVSSSVQGKNSWDSFQLTFKSTKHVSKAENKDFVYVTSPKTGVKHSMAGWVFGNSTNRKIPILEKVVRYFQSDTPGNREQQVADYAVGRTLYAKSEYLSGFENRDNLEQIVWYKSRPGYHIYPLTWNTEQWDNQDFYPAFPMDYDYIPKVGVSGPGYTEKQITIDNSMEEGFLVCGIRPYTKQGILGRLVGSMPIYLSKLPFDKKYCLFREDISIINPNELIKKYPPDGDGDIKVKELEAWNNEEVSSSQGKFSVPTGKEGVLYLLRPEQTGIIRKDGTEFETKSRYFSFSGDMVGIVTPLQEEQFKFFVVFGKGSTVNQEGNIISIPFLQDNVKATEITAVGSGNNVEVDKVTVLAKFGFEKIQLIRPEQILTSKNGKRCKVEEQILATADISEDMKKKIEFGKKAGVFTIEKGRSNLKFELSGQPLGEFDISSKGLYSDSRKASVYLGSLAQIDDIKLSTEAAVKGEYKSAEVHIYELLALKEHVNAKTQTDAMMERYGIEK